MRPKSIRIFEILAWIAVGLSTIGVLIILAFVGGLASGYMGSVLLILLIPMILIAGLGVTTFLAARKRSNAARFVFVGLAAVYVLLAVLGTVQGRGAGGIANLLNLLQIGLLIGAIVCLFQAGSTAWFAQGRGHPFHQGAAGYPNAGHHAHQGEPGGYPPPPYGGHSGYPGTGGQAGYPHAPSAAANVASSRSFDSAPPTPQLQPADPWVGSGASQPTGASRSCPFCAEEIKAEAIKCRFCGSAVEPVGTLDRNR